MTFQLGSTSHEAHLWIK